MATLNQNINQAITDFGSIKTAIENKGVTVPSGTPTSQYASKIGSIQTGITPTGTVNITSNGTTDVTQYASANVNVSGGADTLKKLIDRTLTSIDIPSGITIIGHCSFEGSQYLTTVNCANTVTIIGDYAFAGCENLQTVNFSDNLDDIEPYAFSSCGLTTVNLLNTQITRICDNAFSDCSDLASVYLPNSVLSIWEYAFVNSGLTDIYYTGTQAQWQNISIGVDAIPAGVTIHYNYSPS